MSYWREFLLLGLLLAGLEIAVGGISLIAEKLAEALGTSGASVDPDRGGLRLALGLLMAVLGTGGLAASVWVRNARRRLTPGKNCPRCDSETARIRRRRRDRLLSRLLGHKLQRRRCTRCAWEGLCAP